MVGQIVEDEGVDLIHAAEDAEFYLVFGELALFLLVEAEDGYLMAVGH